MIIILLVGTQKAMPVCFLFTSGMTLPTVLAVLVDAKMMLWETLWLSLYSFPEGPSIFSLLGGSDGIDCGHESLYDAKVVMVTLARGAR